LTETGRALLADLFASIGSCSFVAPVGELLALEIL
jgi:hypothetical protein